MNKVIIPDYWDEEDKANYFDLISRGQSLIGKTIAPRDEFLIDMSAKMTINQIKGYKDEKTEEEVAEQMKKHKDAQEESHIFTPEGLYEEGQHPLDLNKDYVNEPNLIS